MADALINEVGCRIRKPETTLNFLNFDFVIYFKIISNMYLYMYTYFGGGGVTRKHHILYVC